MAIYTGSNKHLGGTEASTTGKQQFFYGLVQKNVLITGANGQLGNELAEWSKKTNSTFKFLFTDADTLDITDAAQVDDYVNRNALQFIINCAAYTAVDKAETDKELCYLINCTGAQNLAKAAARHNCRLIHVSTDYVFDGKASRPYTETDSTNPQSVYGTTKLQGEQAIIEADPQAVIIRTSWLYSTYGKNFVKTMLQLMNDRDQLSIVADQHGTPTYAADLAEMILHIMEQSEQTEWKPGVYHFSNQGETTWYEFAAEIKRIAKIDNCTLHAVTTAEYPTPAARPAYSVMDKSKIESAFHVVIPQWQEALTRCIKKLNE